MSFDLTNTLPIGTRLNSGQYTYTITAVLGRGGFGITYRAEMPVRLGNIMVNASFCIKEFFPKMGGERATDGTTMIVTSSMRETIGSCLRDFRSEARRLNALSGKHPGIVSVNEVFDANGTSYYVMEYLDGESLKSYIDRCGTLSQDEMLEQLRPIVDAVAFLHERNFTHLDIKPANIMLATDPERPEVRRPVLIDFGLSKHYDENGAPTSTLNQSGISHGYSPREQYSGITSFSPWADVYALGATMLTCLTGEIPPKSTELADEDLPGLIPQDISYELRSALLGSLALNRGRRIQNAGKLLAVLPEESDIFPNTQYTVPTPAKVSTPSSRPLERKARVVEPDDTPATGPKSNSSKKIILWVVLAVLAAVSVTAFFLTKGRGSEAAGVWKADSAKVEAVASPMQEHPVEEVTNKEFTFAGNERMKYTGPVDEQGLPHGEGVARGADLIYHGDFVHGKREGRAELKFDDGTSFTGRYANDLMEEGTYSFSDGSKYEGTFKNSEYWNGTYYDAPSDTKVSYRSGKQE